MVEYTELTIDELLLDEDNPRLGAVKSQSEALETLIRLSEAHFRNMMLSIKNNGLDPGDSLYIVEAADDGDFIVLEGNRRLSALKVLNAPDLLDGTGVADATKKSLLRAAQGFDRTTVEPIRCVLFPGRDDAHDWIQRRHTGAADGEGRIQWGPLEVQRFSGDRSVLDVIEFVGRNAEYSDAEWESTRKMIESRKSSTLARLLESKAGRDHLGISIAKGNPETTPLLSADPKWAIKVLSRMIEDVRDGVVDSRGLNKSSDIEGYFAGLPNDLQPTAKKQTPKPFRDISLKQPAKPAANTTPRKTTKTPRPRKTLAPKTHPFEVPSSTKGERLRYEAQTLDADRFPLAASFILRSFVELAIHDYMETNNLPKTEQKGSKTVELNTSAMAERVLQDITAKKTIPSSDLRGFRANMVTKTSQTSIQSLNGFLHNKYQIPTADALRAGWDSCVPLFIATFGEP